MLSFWLMMQMKYITGIHALNLPCPLRTDGDWHASALKWEKITFAESSVMFFSDYGINAGISIPEHSETYYVADHIRALLDLLQWGKFSVAQGMNNDFILLEIQSMMARYLKKYIL